MGRVRMRRAQYPKGDPAVYGGQQGPWRKEAPPRLWPLRPLLYLHLAILLADKKKGMYELLFTFLCSLFYL
jgi:hypothetical protein